MPYFENAHLLFIHIPKTGGSNIENFFMTYLSQKPTINQLLSNNLDLKINNHSLQHMTYQEFYNNKDFFNLHFDIKIKILTVVRNPYNRIISDLFYLKFATKNNNKDEIQEIIKKYLNNNHLYDNHKLEQYKFLIDNDNNINNNIIILNSETLNDQMNKLGFPEFSNFCNQMNTKITTDYYEYLNETSIKMINEYYKKDFEYFNYEML